MHSFQVLRDGMPTIVTVPNEAERQTVAGDRASLALVYMPRVISSPESEV